MPVTHRPDPLNPGRFNGFYRQENESEWLIVRRLALPDSFYSAEAAEAGAIRRLEADEEAVQAASSLFSGFLGLWIAGLIDSGSAQPPAHRWLAHFAVGQFESGMPFGVHATKWMDYVKPAPEAMRRPLQFHLLVYAVLLLRSAFAVAFEKQLIDKMENEIGAIERKTAWGDFPIGRGIHERMHKMDEVQKAFSALVDPSSAPGYGSPAYCAAYTYLVLDGSSPYYAHRATPSDELFDAVLCAFAEMEDDVSPVLRHFVRDCQRAFSEGSQGTVTAKRRKLHRSPNA